MNRVKLFLGPILLASLFINITPAYAEYNIEAEIYCLAKNIYFEANNQSTKGRIAVGQVTLNRVYSLRFPDTICGVVEQRRRRGCQFSWFCDGKSDKPNHKSETWMSILVLAKTLVTRPMTDTTGGALYFHADYVYPRWRKKMTYIAKIDDHLFYKPLKSRKT